VPRTVAGARPPRKRDPRDLPIIVVVLAVVSEGIAFCVSLALEDRAQSSDVLVSSFEWGLVLAAVGAGLWMLPLARSRVRTSRALWAWTLGTAALAAAIGLGLLAFMIWLIGALD
jgi:hypothetical protein